MDDGDLPPGWERLYSPELGKYYYVDHNNQTTQWSDPRRYNSTGRSAYPVYSNFPNPSMAANPNETYYPTAPMYSYGRPTDDFAAPMNGGYDTMPCRMVYGNPPFRPFYYNSRAAEPWSPSMNGAPSFRPYNSGPREYSHGVRRIPVQYVKKKPDNSSTVVDSKDGVQSTRQDEQTGEQAFPESVPLEDHQPSQNPDTETGPASAEPINIPIVFDRESLHDTEGDNAAHAENMQRSLPRRGKCNNQANKKGRSPQQPYEDETAPSAFPSSTFQPQVATDFIPVSYQSLPNRHVYHGKPCGKQSPSPKSARASAKSTGDRKVEQDEQHEEKQPPKPPPPTPYEMIERVLGDLKELEPQVEAYSSGKKDRTYLYLEDQLDKLLLRLDNVDSSGDEGVRQKRRQACKQILEVISLLESKLQEKDESPEKTGEGAEAADVNTNSKVNNEQDAQGSPPPAPAADTKNETEMKPSEPGSSSAPASNTAPESSSGVDNTAPEKAQSSAVATEAPASASSPGGAPVPAPRRGSVPVTVDGSPGDAKGDESGTAKSI
ncbi:unnamed protein product [Calicophoron daubneyi]|uniref:BAG family molecular chaperone regulator 3 n=1 Tax=Calicophoron daubneyi TaxID=300641 RepID=A0AAV2TAR2_CALDB